MNFADARETLEEQLQLLSKRSKDENLSASDLSLLTGEMVDIAKVLFPYG